MHNFPCNKLFIIRLAVFECNVFESFKLLYLRIILHSWMLVAQLTIKKLFQYVQWLLGVVFENYIFHRMSSFLRRQCETFRRVSLSMNVVYFNSVAKPTFCSEIVTTSFRFRLHYLLFSQRKWRMSRLDSTNTFMNETGSFASELVHMYA